MNEYMSNEKTERNIIIIIMNQAHYYHYLNDIYIHIKANNKGSM